MLSREEIPDRLRLPAQPKDRPQQAGLLASGSLRLSTFPVAQWCYGEELAGYSCGNSAGLPPTSLLNPLRGTCYTAGPSPPQQLRQDQLPIPPLTQT